MNKSDLIAAIAEHANQTKADAGHGLENIIKSIETALKAEDSVALVGFGSFEVKELAERKGRNPQTGEEITIVAAKLTSFKSGKTLKDAVNA